MSIDYTKTSDLSGSIQILSNTLSSSMFYTPWYHITLSVEDDSKTLEFCSDTPESSYLVSIENSKNGTGLCNSYTIVISWRPKFNEDVNKLEEIISSAGLKTAAFSLQYGYKCHSYHLVSPKYEGIITNYTVEIQNGYLKYTITGYSSITTLNDYIINPTSIVSASEVNPITAAESVIQYCIDNHGLAYTLVRYETYSVNDVNLEASGLLGNKTTMTDWVNSVLSLAVASGESESTPINERSRFTFVVDDANREIYIRRVTASDSTASAISLPFNWMNPGIDGFTLIHDFKPSYDGSLLMAYSSSQGSSGATATINADGTVTLHDFSAVNTLITAGQMQNDNAATMSEWVKKVQDTYYKATLRTVGIPFEIPLLTAITVVPYINNTVHHSSGKYLVMSAVDRIDSSGFESTFELFKTNSK